MSAEAMAKADGGMGHRLPPTTRSLPHEASAEWGAGGAASEFRAVAAAGKRYRAEQTEPRPGRSTPGRNRHTMALMGLQQGSSCEGDRVIDLGDCM